MGVGCSAALLLWGMSGGGRPGGDICLAVELGLMGVGWWWLLATVWRPLELGGCWTVPRFGDWSWIAHKVLLASGRAARCVAPFDPPSQLSPWVLSLPGGSPAAEG